MSLKYTHLLQYVASTPWAMLQSKIDDMLSVLAFRAAGHTFTAEEIRARLGESTAASSQTNGAIAVVPVRGMITHRMGGMEESSGGMSAERVTAMVRRAAADASVSAIVLDVDSPGGTVPGVLEAADAVYEARASKRIVAVCNATCASAAYWIASQAHEVVAIPSALDACIGSIGVFCVHQDVSAALKHEGIEMTLIRAGKEKAAINPWTPLTDEQRAEMQAGVDAAYAQFVRAVARGRGVSTADVRRGYGEGRALSATDAKAAGLVDRIATFDDVLLKLAGRSSKSGMRASIDEATCPTCQWSGPLAEFDGQEACCPRCGCAVLATATGIGARAAADRTRLMRLL